MQSFLTVYRTIFLQINLLWKEVCLVPRAQAAVFLTQDQILMILEMCNRSIREVDSKRYDYEVVGRVSATIPCERYLTNAYAIRCKLGEALDQF